MRARLALGGALVAVAAGFSAPAHAIGCPLGLVEHGTGLTSPLSHHEITYCWFPPPPAP